jgi:type III pantothenate kinase
MLCAVDIGNSNIVIGLYEDGSWRYRWRMETAAEKTADEYWVLIKSLFREHGAENIRPERAVLSSVVPELTSAMIETLTRLSGREPLLVSPLLETGLTISTDNPRELGADLLANAAAAYHKEQKAVIAVDFGTALTCIAVDDQGAIRGVSISPGVQTAMEALSQQAAQLPHVPLALPQKVLGTDTVGAIQSGLMHGYVGMVEHLVGEMRRELGRKARVLATGGMAQRLAPAIPCIDETEPWLTLEGLRLIAEKNS